MLAPPLLFAAQLVLTQASFPAAQAPTPDAPVSESGLELAPRMSPLQPASARLSLIDAKPRSRPSPAWVLLRAPLALGAGAVAGVIGYFAGYVLTDPLTWPFGCFTLGLGGGSSSALCHVVPHMGAFLMAGASSGAAVAGVSVLLHGEGDSRHPAIAGFLVGTGFAIAYALRPWDTPLPSQYTLKGEGMAAQRVAFIAAPALAVLAYEVGALLLPSHSLKLAPTVTPLDGGAMFGVGGRF